MPHSFARFLQLRTVALLGLGLLLWGGSRAAPPVAPEFQLRGLRWHPEGNNLVFEIELSAAPYLRIGDELLRKRYLSLDLYNADAPPSAPIDPHAIEPRAVGTYGATGDTNFKIGSNIVTQVRRIYYGPQRVLRYVFYARGDVRYTLIQGKVLRLTFMPVAPVPLRSAGSAAGSTRKRVVIDPGHGGFSGDPVNATGAETSRPINGRTFYEKELTLQISQRLKTIIDRSPNLIADLTRTSDYAVTLPERIRKSETLGGDLFVSIHLNATDSHSKDARGFEIFYLDNTSKATSRLLLALENDENINLHADTSGDETLRDILQGLADDSLRQRQAESMDLAVAINEQFLRKGPFRAYHRGVKGAAFRVLMNYSMPAVLAEIGFIDNPDEAAELVRPEVQDKIAALLFNGINRYFAREDPRFKPFEARVD